MSLSTQFGQSGLRAMHTRRPCRIRWFANFVHSPRGTILIRSRCKGWPQEAALRMLMNNLDPEVAERPDDLVVYGGTGKARATGRRSTRSCATLRALEHDETLLVQSGKPVGVFRTHPARRACSSPTRCSCRVGDVGHFRELETAA
jgi:urocanate hydratase